MAYEVDAQGYGNPPGWNDSQKIAPDSLQGLLDWFRERVAWYHYQLGDSAMLTDKGSGRRLYVDEYIAHLLHLAKLRGECLPWLDFCPDGNLASTCQSLLAELEKARAERGIPTEKPGETEVDISSLLDEAKFNWTLMNEGGHKKQYLAEQALRNAHRWLLFHGHYDAPELPKLLSKLGPGVYWHPVDAENGLAQMLKYLGAKPAGNGQDGPGTRKANRRNSTGRGYAKSAMESALLTWHKWDEGSIGNRTPATIPDLMELAGVSKGAASGFLKKHFGGAVQYRARCRETAALAAVLWKIDGSGPDRFSGGGDALDHVADPDAVDHNAPED